MQEFLHALSRMQAKGMNKLRRLATAAISLAVIGTSAFAAYQLVTNPELRGRIRRSAQDALDVSRKRMSSMTEDVALRTAQMTKNPQINRDWVAHQWEQVGY